MRYSFVFVLALTAALMGIITSNVIGATVSGLVDIDIKNVSVKQAIDTLFEGRGLSYYIQDGVKGNIVELRLKGIAFDEALKAMGDAVGFSFRIENGAYIIGPGAAQAKTARQSAPATQYTSPAPTKSSADSMGAGPNMQPMPQPQILPQPVVVNNVIPMPNSSDADVSMPYFNPYLYGGWGPLMNIWNGPTVFGRFPQPPPPSGWVSPDVERFLRFEWAVRRRPGFIAPYPYFSP